MPPRATRPPDFLLKAMNKLTDEKTGRIGAAWNNPDGSINIILDPLIHIQADRQLELRLFPYDPDRVTPKPKPVEMDPNRALFLHHQETTEKAPPRRRRKAAPAKMEDLPASVTHKIGG